MLDLFDDVLDYDATAKRVDYYLSIVVTKLLRIANESPAALKSPSMDGMPRSPHYENVNETKMQKYIDAKTEINAVGMVIMRCSSMAQTILTKLYINHLPNVIVCDTIGYSRSQFAHLKKEALNEFADRFECVRGGRDLHVYDE